MAKKKNLRKKVNIGVGCKRVFHEGFIENLKKGDRILTNMSGGTIVKSANMGADGLEGRITCINRKRNTFCLKRNDGMNGTGCRDCNGIG